MTNALLLLQPTHTAEQKRIGAITHGFLNGLALAAFTTAVIIILYNKNAHGAAHFTTAHGRIGITTYILLIIQVSEPFTFADLDYRWCTDVLLPPSFWICGERQVHLEIPSSKWICSLDLSSRELCPWNAEYMVH